MDNCLCLTNSKYYCIIPTALMTETLGKSLRGYGFLPQIVYMNRVDGAEPLPSKYFVVGVKRPYLDCLHGFLKFNRDEMCNLIGKIRDESIVLSDVYAFHNGDL